MFIGIAGPQYSGKHTIAQYLIERHKFKHLALKEPKTNFGRESMYQDAVNFDTVEDMQLHPGALETEVVKRPFFLLVSVEAPITMRYQRGLAKCKAMGTRPRDLDDFLIQDDEAMFNISAKDQLEANTITPLYNIMVTSDLIITNLYKDICTLYEALDRLNMTNKERLRPSWDTYFMQLSDLAARRSNCMKRRVGCILVKDSRVMATGYNGTPRGLRNCNEGGCGRCNEGASCGTGLDRCLCMHAEENALLEAGRGSFVFDSGVILYCNTCPCLGCAIKIIQQGIKEVVYNRSYGMDQMTAQVFKEAQVKLRQHSPPSMQIEIGADIEEQIALLALK
ncbi:hypothetical protein [Parasitella parasitica]|uniref:Deoxycytidylate deaminase n=1 Tax=Parasitella parasitica TaxID=35722 RepID=A0A0B7NDV3_9FUNG|nr:hypothetical protein [Parasitella parasitica]